MMIAFACRRGSNGVLRRLCLASVIGCAVAATAWAQAPESLHDYALPAASLTQSINAIGQSNDVQVIYDAALLQGKTAGPISGHFTLSQALDKALAGSGLTYELVNSGHTVVIRKTPLSPQKNNSAALKNEATKTKENVEPTILSTVAVTGTRIRGGVTASPTITINAQQIQDEGFSDLGEVIRSIPQNFNGGQNPGVVNGSASSQANQNITGGSGLNLRGLGPDATLTLLNGRRMSYEGFSQSVDISAIPIGAVDRIEIVPDGASAIYGSDAVAGAANVILKRDFDGATVGTRYGSATDGGLITREYTGIAGTTWATGGLIATWEKASNDPVYSDQRDYTKNMYAPTTIFPGDDLRSGMLSVHQQISDVAEFSLDTLRTEREDFQNISYGPLYYRYMPDTTTTFVSPSIEVSLPNDWILSVGGTWGKDASVYDEAAVSTATNVVSADYRGTYNNKSHTYDIGAEGPLFTLPGGDARLAVGIGYRNNYFLYRDSGITYANGEEDSRFAYAELNLPLIGQNQNIAGVRRLEFTAAVRGEDYDSFGRIATPKLGLIYGPSSDFTLKASWGKSFKAPKLLNKYQVQSAYLYPATMLGGTGYASDATALVLSGGNPNLDPERARTSSASLLFHPESMPRLEVELTGFNIYYADRVVLPLGAAVYQALGSSIYAEFVDHDPTVSEQAALLAKIPFFYNYAGTAYDPSKVVAVIDNRYVNASSQKIKGIDLSGSYVMDLAYGRLIIRGSASWLDSTQQLTSAQRPYDLAGTLFNPPKISGRLGATWSRESFSSSAFVNYKSGVSNIMDDVKSASFTTFDLTLRYDTGKRNDMLSGLAFELSAQNLFDRAPPLYAVTSSSVAPYDSTNYSAIGRFISVSVSKHW